MLEMFQMRPLIASDQSEDCFEVKMPTKGLIDSREGANTIMRGAYSPGYLLSHPNANKSPEMSNQNSIAMQRF